MAHPMMMEDTALAWRIQAKCTEMTRSSSFASILALAPLQTNRWSRAKCTVQQMSSRRLRSGTISLLTCGVASSLCTWIDNGADR